MFDQAAIRFTSTGKIVNYTAATAGASSSDSGHSGTLLTLSPRPKLSTIRRAIPWTLVTPFWDSSDETRGYPVDSSDETNN
jgi:hypothetical protein